MATRKHTTDPLIFTRPLDYADAAAHGIICLQETIVDGNWRMFTFTVDGEIAYQGANPFIGETECNRLLGFRIRELVAAQAAEAQTESGDGAAPPPAAPVAVAAPDGESDGISITIVGVELFKLAIYIDDGVTEKPLFPWRARTAAETVDIIVQHGGASPQLFFEDCTPTFERRVRGLLTPVAVAAPTSDDDDDNDDETTDNAPGGLVERANHALALAVQEHEDAALAADHAAYADVLAVCSRTHAARSTFAHLANASDVALQATLAIIFQHWQGAVLAADLTQMEVWAEKGKMVSEAWKARCWADAGLGAVGSR